MFAESLYSKVYFVGAEMTNISKHKRLFEVKLVIGDVHRKYTQSRL
jgi:hypothetical protein